MDDDEAIMISGVEQFSLYVERVLGQLLSQCHIVVSNPHSRARFPPATEIAWYTLRVLGILRVVRARSGVRLQHSVLPLIN